jgi:hypothetical protein
VPVLIVETVDVERADLINRARACTQDQPTRVSRPSPNVNGYRYQTTIGRMRGEYLFPVSAAVREQAGVSAGDKVDATWEAGWSHPRVPPRSTLTRVCVMLATGG